MRYDFYAGEMELIDPHPLPLDNKLTEICRRFAGSDVTTRAITRTSVSMDDFYTLFTFARRSAVFALRDNQSSHIIDGLTALAVIEPKRVDFRDALVPLALLYNAAIRIGDNPDTLVRTAVALAESNMSALMEGFINRSPNDKDLRQWGHCGNEEAWWHKTGLEPLAAARAIWLETHPLPKREATGEISMAAMADEIGIS